MRIFPNQAMQDLVDVVSSSAKSNNSKKNLSQN
jgi:hypothetical protein